MSQNPYAFAGQITAAEAGAAERATFLKKVYSLILAGILVFAGSLWGFANVPALTAISDGLWQSIAGSRFGWLLYMGIAMGGFFLVHAVARVWPINLAAYFAWSFVLALLVAPLVLHAANAMPETLNLACMVTALVFTGLTAFVIMTGKDFSFLRGALFLGFWLLLVLALCGWIFGFQMGLWFSGLAVLLFAGYILYDTSEVMRRFPTNMAVSAAVILFTDVIYLFKHALILLMSLRSD